MALPLPFDRALTTPSEVNRRIKRLLEGELDELWVKGELSNVTRAASGHLYFSLKDATSQLRCAMWKSSAMRLRFQPAPGMEVEVRGTISVYEPRGEYQLSVTEMNPAGLGALYVALEALKAKLAAEGLFSEARKRPLPAYPATVGIVTSGSGAAVRDIIRVARGRWPGIRLVLAPVKVQGEGAAQEIARGIERLNALGAPDVLIVGRGGGSTEDLWAFNEEPVVRAIAASGIPVVSAVGHEKDFTLSDLVADRRAATPSNAAELVVPDAAELRLRVERLGLALGRAVRQGLLVRRRRIEAITATYGFKRPRDFLAQQGQRVDELARRLELGGRRLVADQRRHVADLERRLAPALVRRQGLLRQRVVGLARQLASLDPTAVLGRGYCLVFAEEPGAPDVETHVVRAAAELAAGQTIRLRFAGDRARARVEEVLE